MTTRTGGTPVPPPESPDEDQIMEAMAIGDRSPADIASKAGISILELARIVTTPDNLRQLQQVTQLHAIEREMLLGRLKIDALVRLRELTDDVPVANADEIRAAEVMRKACVDLLRFGGSNSENRHSQQGEPRGGGPESRGYHPESITPAFEAEILEALERLGEEKYEYEPGATDSDRRESSVWPASTASNHTDDFGRRGDLRCQWHPDTPGGEGVKEVEITHDMQVGMAFGKTSDHGTEPPEMTDRTGETPVPPSEEAITRTGETPCPPMEEADDVGCHGQVPPARDDFGVGSLSSMSHGQAPKTPLAHATHDPLHKARPPPGYDSPRYDPPRQFICEVIGLP